MSEPPTSPALHASLRQGELAFERPETTARLSEADWSRHLSDATGSRIQVRYSRARREVIQSRGYWNDPSGRPVELRLAGFFAKAPEEVRDAVASWLRKGKRAKRASRLLDDWIAEAVAELPPKRRRRSTLAAVGEVHDLAPLVAELLDGEFEPADFAPLGLPEIGWGRRQKSRAKRSLQLGSYAEDLHRVRVHPVLDQAGVPLWFVRFVVFHELLHAARTAAARRGEAAAHSRLHHDRAFREREALFADHAAAQEWQARQVAGLLRSAKSGKPFKPSGAPRARAALRKLLGR